MKKMALHDRTVAVNLPSKPRVENIPNTATNPFAPGELEKAAFVERIEAIPTIFSFLFPLFRVSLLKNQFQMLLCLRYQGFWGSYARLCTTPDLANPVIQSGAYFRKIF